MASGKAPGSELAIVKDGQVNLLALQNTLLPEQYRDIISLPAWADSLINRAPYVEPDPDYLSRTLLIQTLTADTIDEVMDQAGVQSLQKAIPDFGGAGTGPVIITDIYVTDSDFGEGAPCYLIITAQHIESGIVKKYSTGAQQLQAQFIRILSLGMWPIRCQITRLDRKDKGGRHLFWLAPVDAGEN